MNDFFAGIARFVLRVVFLFMGLVFAATLLFAVLVLACIWALRAGWARLTGRPVTPWVMRFNPQDGWNRFNRAPGPWPGPQSGEPAPRRDLTDVTDVEVKEPRP